MPGRVGQSKEDAAYAVVLFPESLPQVSAAAVRCLWTCVLPYGEGAHDFSRFFQWSDVKAEKNATT
jgi:hypothetical protein